MRNLEFSSLIRLLFTALYSCRALCDWLLHETFPQMTPYNLAPLNSPNQNTRISFPVIAVFIYRKNERCVDFSSGERNLRLSLAKLISNWENGMLMIKPRTKKKTHTHTEKKQDATDGEEIMISTFPRNPESFAQTTTYSSSESLR